MIFFLAGTAVHAAMTSTNYQIGWDSMNGGGIVSTSTSYSVLDTVGQLAIGNGTSSNYGLIQGYGAIEYPGLLSLVIRTTESAVYSSSTAFNAIAKTVTVASAAPFSVGDYITVIENVGFNEKIAVGKIISISGNTLTVDRFDGDQSSMSAIPSGGDDFVYRANGTAAGFGTINAGNQNVGETISSVVSSNSNGYTVYLQANHPLQNGSGHNISDVSDGTVSVGSEEYGASTTGTTALLTGSDFPITTAQQAIQSNTNISASPADRAAIIYKLSVTPTTNNGTYSQSLFYTLTANF